MSIMVGGEKDTGIKRPLYNLPLLFILFLTQTKILLNNAIVRV